MSRIIMDVTQLAHRTGKITGIPRVMDELAKRLRNATGQEVAFVSWVADKKKLCEIDFEQTLVARSGIVYRQQPSSDNKAKAPRIINAGNLNSFAKQFAKKVLSIIEQASPHTANKLKSKIARTRISNYEAFHFDKDDILIIPWGEWWNPAFTECLLQVQEKGTRLVQIIHDIGPTVWPQLFEQVKVSPTDYNAQIVPICDLVLTVSHNTKKELTDWLHKCKLAVPRIEVFRLGDDLQISKPTRPTDVAFKTSGLNGNDYILCVGTIEAKKNHQLFYYVYKLAISRGIKLPKLVMVGRKGHLTEATIHMMTDDPEVRDYFLFMFDTSDEELSWLYDHCMFTILPSFHEGWGIPIAESLARGVPSLCSDTSSMVEIAEGIVGHFSPFSPDECLTAIQSLLEPNKLAAARRNAKTYKQFSWDQSFNQVYKYLKTIK